MSLVIDLPQPIEARLEEEAARIGVTAAELVIDVIKNTFSAPIDAEAQKQLNASSIVLLQRWLKEGENCDSEDTGKSEQELEEFKRNLNASRKETGSRLLFPDAEAKK